MDGFEKAWAAVAKPRRGESVSQELKALLQPVYLELQTTPVDLHSLKNKLIALFEYLRDKGRTNANCWAVDLFFCLSDEIGWERDWADAGLPDEFHDVLAFTAEALHDAVESPEIAENFDCLPEQLLERTRRLSI